MPRFCTLSLAGEPRYAIEPYSMSLRAGKVLIGHKRQYGVWCTPPLLSGRVLKSGHFTIQLWINFRQKFLTTDYGKEVLILLNKI